MKLYMDRRHYKEVVPKFLSIICQRDQEQAKALSGNNQTFKTKREQIFEELNQMIAYTKRLEFEIKRGLDTPLRIFKILIARMNSLMKYSNIPQPGNPIYQNLKDLYFEDEIKLEDIAKIMKFAN